MNLQNPLLSPDFVLKQIQLHIEPKAEAVKIEKLAGDASNRSYYRLKARLNGHGYLTYVLMVLADPEPFKQSEEKESGKVSSGEIPFLNIHRHFESCGAPVPKVYYQDTENGLIYLEDLGNVTFEQVVKTGPSERLKNFYRKAIDELIKIQLCRKNHLNCIAFDRSYNHALFVWEFNHFLEYGVEKRKGGSPPVLDDLMVFREMFNRISTILSSEAAVLVHRDYHSRNLMVQGETLRVIDFQDALMGPSQYDLASLLRDAYMTLPEETIDEMVEYFIEQKEKNSKGTSVNRRQFRYLFDLTSLQRNMKAAGRFIFIDQVKKNPNFLQYVPKALKDISINLNKYPELEDFKSRLGRYLPELA